MSFFDPKQWLIVIAFGLACVLGYNFWSARLVAQGVEQGRVAAKAEYEPKLAGARAELADVKAQYAASVIAAQAAAAKQTKEWQDDKDKADVEAHTREAFLRRTLVSLGDERNGLRRELAASRDKLSTASCSSVREYAATVNGLLDQCAEAVEEYSGKASGHAIDSLKLQQAWPK